MLVIRTSPSGNNLISDDGVHHCLVGGSSQGADGSTQPQVWEKSNKMAF